MKSVIAVQFRRKLSGRTNYRKRLALLKSGLPRLVVRKSLTGMILQVVDFGQNGDRVVLSVTSKKLRALGWRHSCKNIPAAYLAGMLAGRMALARSVHSAVPDTGMQAITKGGKVFAAIKGAKDAGLAVNVSDDIVPSEDAIKGLKIEAYAGNAAVTQDFEKVKAVIGGNGWEAAIAAAKDGRK